MVDRVCKTCQLPKTLEELCKNKNSKDGRRSLCKACHSKNNRYRYLKNPDKFADMRARNKESIAQGKRSYYLRNRDKVAADNDNWRKANLNLWRGYSAKRKAKKIMATPLWASEDAIKLMYTKAQRLQSWLEEEFHVDHIVPLISDFVCGLHCEANLQILTSKDNISKGNRWWPDMWNE